MTREQMVAEFGEPGVQNAKVIDLITVDPVADTVVLVMVERRVWGGAPQQFKEIEEKINRYLGYALDGFLIEHHPAYKGKAVRIRLDCAEAPHGEAVAFVAAATQAIRAQGIEFALVVTPPAAG
ncbi:MAG: DUF6572 domain-containing protein [Bacteroidota bacterium]